MKLPHNKYPSFFPVPGWSIKAPTPKGLHRKHSLSGTGVEKCIKLSSGHCVIAVRVGSTWKGSLTIQGLGGSWGNTGTRNLRLVQRNQKNIVEAGWGCDGGKGAASVGDGEGKEHHRNQDNLAHCCFQMLWLPPGSGALRTRLSWSRS